MRTATTPVCRSDSTTASVWGLSEWHFDDLTEYHPSEFEGLAREVAYADQDYTDNPEDPNETVQCTILSRQVADTD